MKIGILVDGDAESQAIKLLTRKIQLPKKIIIGKVLYANMQPKSTPKQIAQKAAAKIPLLSSDHDHIVILIDREDRKECPCSFAKQINVAVAKLSSVKISVVVKDRKFENWLIASPSCFTHNNSRFSPNTDFAKTLSICDCDKISDAETVINKICQKKHYHKRSDPLLLIRNVDIPEMASKSRSFRRFLRVIGYTKYNIQSKLP